MDASSDSTDSADTPDVSDPVSFETYKKIRTEWIEAFQAPIHGIWRSLSELTHRLAVYHVVSLQREERGYEESEVSGMFDYGYLALQSMAIRRLISTRKKDHAVGTLLASVIKNRELISRENYLASCEIPYDVDKAHLLWRKDAGPSVQGKVVSSPNVGPKAGGTAMSAHRSFDRLSGVQEGERSRADLIRLEIIEAVQNRLQGECRGWGILADKLFAHGATQKDLEAAQGHMALSVDVEPRAPVASTPMVGAGGGFSL